MQLENYEVLILVLAILATVAAIVYAVWPVGKAQSRADRPETGTADPRSERPYEPVEAARPVSGPPPRVRPADSLRSGSARRAAKSSATAGRPEPTRSEEPESLPVNGGMDPKASPGNGETATILATPPEAAIEEEDDLTRIRGIGKSIERRLNGMGVVNYSQIAAWSEEDLRRVDDAFAFRGRAKREDWIGQAKRLSEEKRR